MHDQFFNTNFFYDSVQSHDIVGEGRMCDNQQSISDFTNHPFLLKSTLWDIVTSIDEVADGTR